VVIAFLADFAPVAAAAACEPNAFLKPSLDQADTRVVGQPRRGGLQRVGLLVAHSRNRKTACLYRDLALMHACQCDINGTAARPSRGGAHWDRRLSDALAACDERGWDALPLATQALSRLLPKPLAHPEGR
jgi:hypothetical protein